jgi:hypothetical protein
VFSAPEHEIFAKLDLGDHKTLYVGGHGRRELEENGEMKHAQTLAEEALGGVMRDDKNRFVFVATDGDTYRATDPLGAMERIAPARTEPLASVTTGKAAIVGISPSGLVRSTDFGATWKAVDYGKAYGRAASVVLDGSGNGVLVHLPQRLFVTHDDGATWAPLASPPHGAGYALRDGLNRIFTYGYYDRAATLAKDALTETIDVPASLFPGQKLHEPRTMPDDPSERRPRMGMPHPFGGIESQAKRPIEILAGDRVLEIAAHDGKIETRSAPIGESLGNGTAQSELDEGALDRANVSAWSGDVAYLRAPAHDDDSETPATAIIRSKDHGSTWKKEDAFPGVPAHDTNAIALGPRGWTYVGAICKRNSSDCTPARIRPAGKQAFEAATSDASFDARMFAFDEAHDKVYAIASDGLYAGALGAAKLAKVHMVFAVTPSAMTVDEQGMLRAFERHPGGVFTIRSQSAKGEEQPPRYLQLGEGAIAFAGSHGLLVGNHASWESNDAGETWTRVASNGETSQLSCTIAGCLVVGARRVGWDLPALQSTEIVRATTTPPAEQKPDTTKPAKPKSTPMDLACKVSGKGKTLATSNDVSWIDGTLPARWAQVSSTFMDASKVTLTWADKDTVHETQLLGPKTSTTMELRTASDERDEGVVAARYQYARRKETGDLNPVQVELAWWTPSKPTQVHRANITVKPFRVSRFAFSGRARVVDGGIVFQGGRGDLVHFVHDDGKDETFAAPGIPFSDVARSGNKWVFADTDGLVLETASSEDGGKTWALRGWAFDPKRGDDATVATMNGKPIVRARGALHEIAWPVPSDPPAPTVIDLASREPRCDGAVLSSSERERIDDDSIHMDLAGTKLAGAERVLHVTQSGKLCTAVLQLEQGRDREAYVYPDTGGGWSGWSYRETDDNKTIVEPLTCK